MFITASTKILVFSNINAKSAYLRFLKDHVTLKTRVMTAENSALPSHLNKNNKKKSKLIKLN